MNNKEIKVIDSEHGLVSSTYAKRAFGLVKKRRAVWVDDMKTTIRLLPSSQTEVKLMNSKQISQMMATLESYKWVIKTYGFNGIDGLAKESLEVMVTSYNKICDNLLECGFDVSNYGLSKIDLSKYPNRDDVSQAVSVLLVNASLLHPLIKIERDELLSKENSHKTSQEPRTTKVHINRGNLDSKLEETIENVVKNINLNSISNKVKDTLDKAFNNKKEDINTTKDSFSEAAQHKVDKDLEQLKKEASKVKAKKAELKNLYDVLDKEKAILQDKIAELSNNNSDELEDVLTALENQIDNYDDKLDSIDDQIDELEDELDDIFDEIEEATEKSQDLVDED